MSFVGSCAPVRNSTAPLPAPSKSTGQIATAFVMDQFSAHQSSERKADDEKGEDRRDSYPPGVDRQTISLTSPSDSPPWKFSGTGTCIRSNIVRHRLPSRMS